MRKAFSILEAIATIVILSVIFATIPMLLSKTTEVVEGSLEGEALYHASALITRIASMPFNSVLLDGNESKIINLNASECGSDDGLRDGSREINATKMRQCVVEKTFLEPLIKKDTNQSAINHFQGYKQDLEERGFGLKVDLKYIEDWAVWSEADKGSSNFLLITVTAFHQQDENDVIGALNYVASNIGALE